MNVHPHFNPEEAAHAAIEFVSSRWYGLINVYRLGLDNLPAEVNFLLGEITEKDEKINSEVLVVILTSLPDFRSSRTDTSTSLWSYQECQASSLTTTFRYFDTNRGIHITYSTWLPFTIRSHDI